MNIEAYGGMVKMKIESLSENSFYILLSDEDMKEMGISFEQLDYSNVETRRVIWTLIEKARNTLGRDIDPSGKMLIEVRRESFGCQIKFTLSREGKYGRFKIKKENPYVCASFLSLNAVNGFFHAFERFSSEIKDLKMFRYGERFYLYFECDPFSRERIKMILSEFSRPAEDNKVFLNMLFEHGKLIYSGSFPPPAF